MGTDAAPFFQIFNPISQSRQWDHDGDYMRRFVPELRHLQAPEIHQPAPMPGYPAPIVDHGVEREEALVRFREASARRGHRPR